MRELWFCEPGDNVEPEEVRRLAEAWSDDAEGRLVVAPRFVRAWLAQAGVKARSCLWSPDILQWALSEAERCVFFGPESYSQARRRVAALRSGGNAAPPASIDPGTFEPTQVANDWQETLAYVLARRSLRNPGREPLRILLFVDLIQDLDPILPVLDILQDRSRVKIQVAVTNWVRHRSPRLAAELAARGVTFDTFERSAVANGAGPSLQGIDAVLAAAESSLPAHACSHVLFNRARKAGIPTFVLQHGVENVGLHDIPGEDDATLAADHLFVWFGPDHVPPSVPNALRPRLVHVGRSPPPHPDLSGVSGAFATFDSVVTVFENLHWRRYDEAWRLRFLTDCTEFALADPTRAVILKPHHAGLWSARNRHLIPQWPSNLIVADPTDSFWEPFTATALVQLADAVITTPSTVALDAVQAGKPVAVAAYGLNLPAYSPLPLLQRLEDWSTFIAEAGSVDDAARRATFLTRTADGGHPARDAADYILTAAGEARRSRAAALADRNQA